MVPHHPAAEPCGTFFFLCERSDDSKKMENSIFLKGIGWNEKEGCNGVKFFLNTEYMNVLTFVVGHHAKLGIPMFVTNFKKEVPWPKRIYNSHVYLLVLSS